MTNSVRSVVLVGAALAVAATGAAAPGMRALVGGTLVDGTGAVPVKDTVVVLAGDRIACAGTRAACPVPDGAEVLDVKGSWVTPGIVDTHVHLTQTGWVDSRPDFFDPGSRYPYEKVEADLRAHPERIFRADLCSGVTAVFDQGGYSWTLDLGARTASSPDAPHVAAVGPLLTTGDAPLNLPTDRQLITMSDEKTVRATVRSLAANGSNGVGLWLVRTMRVRPEDPYAMLRAAADEARSAGLPLIVDAILLREAKEALRAGATVLVHSVADAPVDADFIAMAKKNGTVYCPTLTVYANYGRFHDAVASGTAPAIDDPNGCVDALTRARIAETATLGSGRTGGKGPAGSAGALSSMRAVAASNLRAVVAAGIPVAMGTDAGNPLTLHGPAAYTEMEAMQADGMTPMQVLVASTRNGALAMGAAGKEIGTVEAGKVADLLVVAADPTADIAAMRKLKLVIRAGVPHRVSDLAAPR